MRRSIFIVVLILLITGTLQAQDDSITLGQPVNGTLDLSTPTREWRFTAPAGTQASLSVARTSGEAPITINMLKNPNTMVVSLRTNEEGIINLPLLYLEGGDYTIRLIGDFGSSTGATGFELIILPVGDVPVSVPTATPTTASALEPTREPVATLNPEEPIRLEVGDVYEGELETDGEVHRFTFLGYAGSRVTFGMSRMDEESTLDPYIQLQAPNGEIVIEDNDHADTPDALVIYFELPATGVYTLYASSVDNQGTGPYVVAVGEGFVLRDIPQGTAEHNVPIIAELAAYGARDVWTIEAQAGELISIAVDDWGDDVMDPMVELVSPDGETLGFDDDSGVGDNAVLAYLEAPVTGVYRIHVAAFNHASIGTYRLIWSLDNVSDEPTATPTPTVTTTPTITPTPTVTATPSATPTLPPTPPPVLTEASGSLEGSVEPGQIFARAIDGEAGQQLDVYVEGYWGFDSILQVVAESGIVVAEVDDTGYDSNYDINPRLQMTIQISGRYTLQIYGYDNTGGSFRLNWLLQ